MNGNSNKLLSQGAVVLALLLQAFSIAAQNEVPFTLEDRDRLIKIEERYNSLQNQVDDIKTDVIRLEGQISGLRGEIGDLRGEIGGLRGEIKQQRAEIMNLFFWGFGIMIGFMMFLLGYIIWDRRTALHPVRDKGNKMEMVLRGWAKDNPRLAEIPSRAWPALIHSNGVYLF